MNRKLAALSALLCLCLGACGVTAHSDGSGGGPVPSSGGAPGAGGNPGSTGGAITFIEDPASTLPEGCVLTGAATEWTQSRAQEMCFETVEFYTESVLTTRHGYPRFPSATIGGAGGAAPEDLEVCPTAAELDWSCRISEGTTCSTPQCEAPTTPTPVDSKCCYFVYRAAGV